MNTKMTLGAAVVAYLCLNEPALAAARAVYLTPVIGTPLFDPLFIETSQPAMLVIGTGDRFYSKDALAELTAAREFELTEIPDVDHSMNVAGDLSGTMVAVEKVVAATITFLQNGT